MSAHATAASIAYDLFFPWLFFLLPLAGAVALAVRTGWWRAAPWRRLVLLCGAMPLLAALTMGLGLSAWAASREAPLVTITVDRVHCASWADAVLWSEIASVTTRSEKMKHGWRDVGMWLAMKTAEPAAAPQPHPRFESPLFRLAVSLWRGDPLVVLDEHAGSRRHRYCRLTGLDVPLGRIHRTTQELIWARQAIERHYPGHEPALAWCERGSRVLAWECVSNAIRHHRDCRDRTDPAAYDACRAAFRRP